MEWTQTFEHHCISIYLCKSMLIFVPYFSLLGTHSHTPKGENHRFLRQVRTRILSLVDTCRKDRGFCPSDIRKKVSHKPKYGTNLRLLLQRYTVILHSLSHIGQKKPSLILKTCVSQA